MGSNPASCSHIVCNSGKSGVDGNVSGSLDSGCDGWLDVVMGVLAHDHLVC